MLSRVALTVMASFSIAFGSVASGAGISAPLGPGTTSVSAPVSVSNGSPFGAGCQQADLHSRVYTSSAVESMLAADPADRQHLVAIWMQDRIATSAALGVRTGVSHDAGKTWAPGAPAFTRCTGGTQANGGDYPRATDPWLTIAPNSDVYAIALALNAFAGPQTVSAILVSKSVDGGATWTDPVTLAQTPIASGFNDKPTVTADPVDPNFVYAVWDRDALAEQTASGLAEAPIYFSRTTDGGQSWEPARIIYSGRGVETIGHALAVLPSGDLLDFFARTIPRDSEKSDKEDTRDIAFIRSIDRGVTWTEPVSVSDVVSAPLVDAYTTFPLQPDAELATIPTVAIDRMNGTLHVAWQDARFSDRDHVDVAQALSTDGGRTWSGPVRINQDFGGGPAFVPTLAITGDGTTGVNYYQLRGQSSDDQVMPADAWLATCRSACDIASNWAQIRLVGPFDFARAPFGHGYFVGDYEGAVGTAGGFFLFDVLTSPAGASGYSDAFFISVGLP